MPLVTEAHWVCGPWRYKQDISSTSKHSYLYPLRHVGLTESENRDKITALKKPKICNSLYFQKTLEFRYLTQGASTMQSLFTSEERSLLIQLECPVCTEYMRPPIACCANGHNICNNCSHQFLNTRNVALEKLATQVKYPCTYRKYGCMEVYNLAMIGEHEDRCQ